jgi:hypothetical protein
MQKTTLAVTSLLLVFLGLAGRMAVLRGQSASDYAVQASASIQDDPPSITLTWPTVSSASGYSVYRKSTDDTTWGDPVPLPGLATSYVDTNVVVGTAYEYHVWRAGTNYDTHGYLVAGIQVPLVESRGKLILIVENTYASSLGSELARLQQDLTGDGWIVLRHDVPRMAVDPANLDPGVWAARSNELSAVKSLIKTDYIGDSTNVRAVFLFGHVPVPYSGLQMPDEHLEHLGAWPADVYYGDMDGTWTDTSVTSTTAADPRNRNVPGDGKFDQIHTPARVALEVGRVDLANLPIFPQSETELLRQYLNKDHNFRHKLTSVRPRALIDDNFGILYTEVPSANAWAGFAPLVGLDSVSTGRWLSFLPREDYLWAYGCGDGTYSSSLGVADSSHFVVYDTKVIFTMLFGSYFGDWDSQNNFLRAPLAEANYTLTSAWAGRPYWFFHHMALGETIGFSTRLTQSNGGLYQTARIRLGGISVGAVESPTNFMTGVHVALMGDPTLRLQPVASPAALVAVTNAAGGVDLAWSPSTDDVLGYNVYRSADAGGAYARLNTSLVTNNAYSDPAATSEVYYMVRAVRLETSSSGSYYNASQGAFAKVNLAADSDDPNVCAGRAVGTWKINDAMGLPGFDPGWDCRKVDGTLVVTATSSNQFSVGITSLTAENAPGAPANFDNNKRYAWPIVTSSDGITGFDPASFKLVTTDFQGDLGGGVFSLALSDDAKSINLVFTPNHAPAAKPAHFLRPWDAPYQIAIADLLGQFTSDPDGDGRALLRVGTSTNGTSITTDGTYVTLTATNNVRETITYSVQDVRTYRPGDTVRTATSSIIVDPLPTGVPLITYHAIEIQWQGEPGKLYKVQSRLETESEWIDQGDPVVGTGQVTSLFERTSSDTKFYRVILVP